MRWSAILAWVVLSAPMSPIAAAEYTFGNWARDQGYSPGDTMPSFVNAGGASPAIVGLSGIGEFDWTTTPTTGLYLWDNQISSIQSGDFDGLPNLTRLDLGRNQLSSIEPGAFSGLPNLTFLNLDGNLLSSVESGDFDGLPNLTGLWLSGNQISSVESGDFDGLPNLTSLSLGSNISSVQSVDIDGLENLTELRLSGNQIWRLESGDFSGLSNLTSLDLGGNRIRSLQSGDFDGLSNLTRLHLFGNWISRIQPGDFDGLPNLTSLDLGVNRIWGIESGAFSGLSNLTRLWLFGNQISRIQSRSFNGLPNLTELSLNSNQLSQIESGAFDGLANLTRLDLGWNQISRIQSVDFDELTNLTSLGLRCNGIRDIELGDFAGLPNLESLDLSDNQLSSIESDDFDGLPNLTSLRLGGDRLRSVAAIDLSGLPNLTSLSLGSSRIRNIESGDFDRLPNLESLDLSDNQLSSIESGGFDALTNLTRLDLGKNRIPILAVVDLGGLPKLESLDLSDNRISSIQSGDLDGLTELQFLNLSGNQLSSIETGAFSGLSNLGALFLMDNLALTELNLARADFSSLYQLGIDSNVNITSASLRSAVVNQTSLERLMNGCDVCFVDLTGIGELDGITEMDLSGIDFAEITDLRPLYVMDNLTDLWLAGTRNLDASDLDVLLDNLETLEGTAAEGVLHMTRADYDAFNTSGAGLLAAWNGEPGHHIQFVIPTPSSPADFSGNGALDVKDIRLLVEEIQAGTHDPTFDTTQDALVNSDDMTIWVHDYANTWFGDANLDLQFNSGDMVQVFAAGKYETGQPAGWSEGDWNADAVFDSGDMVAAFVDGGYEKGPQPPAVGVPEPASVLLLMAGLTAVAIFRSRVTTRSVFLPPGIGLKGRRDPYQPCRSQRSILSGVGLSILALAVFADRVSAQTPDEDARPFTGVLVGEVNFEFDFENPECPVTTVIDLFGTVSYLGRVDYHATHCAPVALPVYTNGHGLFTAENGEELILEYAEDDGNPFEFDVVGGSGRFEDATGTILLESNTISEAWGDDGLPISPWYISAELTGTVAFIPEPSACTMAWVLSILLVPGVRRRRWTARRCAVR